MRNARQDDRLLTLLGRELSHDTAYFAVAMGAVFPIGIATASVVTGYLAPAEYGEFGLLMLFSALATLVYGLGVLQGTIMWAFGIAGDDADDEAIVEEVAATEVPISTAREQRRRALGSGVVLTTLVALVGTGGGVIGADAISNAITGSDALRTAVIWAAVSAGLGSIWRLTLQVYRLERRGPMFLFISVSRPLLALALAIVLLERGYGIEGAVAAMAIATLVSLLISVGGNAAEYQIGFHPRDFGEIMRRGRSLIPVMVAVWIVGYADLWIVSRGAPGKDVGLYRLASRFGALPSYVTSAFLAAWMPMQRSALFKSNVRVHSRAVVSSTMFTYFCIACSGLLLVLAVGSNLFVQIAPSSYSDAAPLIPAVGAAVAAQGVMYALYRIGRIRNKRKVYVLTLGGAALILLVGGSVLAGPLGGFGVALAGVLGSVTGAAGMLVAIQRGRRPLPLDWSRIAAAWGLGIAGATAVAVSPADGAVRVVQDLAILGLFPILMVATGAVPRRAISPVLEVGRAAFPRRPGTLALVERARELPPPQQAGLARWLDATDRVSVESLTPAPAERESLAALTRAIRTLVERSGATEHDAAIGAYLAHRGSSVDRDHLAEALVEDGADPLDLHLLDDTYRTLRQARGRLLHDAPTSTASPDAKSALSSLWADRPNRYIVISGAIMFMLSLVVAAMLDTR